MSGMEGEVDGTANGSIAALVKLLMEERRARDEELAR